MLLSPGLIGCSLLAASTILSAVLPASSQCFSCECFENCTSPQPPPPPPTTYPPPPTLYPPPPTLYPPPPFINSPPPVISIPPPSTVPSPPPRSPSPFAASPPPFAPPPQVPPGVRAPPPPQAPLQPAPYVREINKTVIAGPRFKLNDVDAALLALAKVDPAAAFAQWQMLVGVSYSTAEEAAFRFGIFKQNVAYIIGRQTTAPNLVLGLGYFSDVTNTEFRNIFLGGAELDASQAAQLQAAGRRLMQASNPFQYADTIPDSQVDWNASGKVAAVVDQGNCNSCWAFTAVSVVESIYAIKTGVLTKLSEQEVMNCGKGSDGGCGKNAIENCFLWLHNNSVSTEANIPYDGLDSTCPYSPTQNPKVSILGYANVPTSTENWDTGLPKSEYNLMQAVTNQPVALRIDAQSQDVQFYKDGYLDCPKAEPSENSTNHFVQLVGYKASVSPIDPKKILPGGYWIARNSWSKQWGQEGYFFLTMGQSGTNGACNILVGPNTYPLSDATSAPPGLTPSAPPPPSSKTTRIGTPLPIN